MTEVIVHIDGGRIVNRTAAARVFMLLKNGVYLLTLKSIKKRSLPQNAYYHGCVVPLVLQGLKDVGYDEVQTHEDVHEILKYLFLKRSIVHKATGEVIAEISGSTAELQTHEFNDYLEKIWKWSAEYLGVHIPAPNEPLAIMYPGKSKIMIEERIKSEDL